MTRRRWLLRISLCLLLGVISTVAVAWACLYPLWTRATTWPPATTTGVTAHTPPAYVYQSGDTFFGLDWTIASRITDAGQLRKELQARGNATTLPPHLVGAASTGTGSQDAVYATTVIVGWPMRCAWCEWQNDRVPNPGFDALIGGIDVSGDGLHYRALPYDAIAPGFVIDVLFFAAIWFGLLFGIGAWRRRRRSRRGLCLHCGHDLRGNPEGITGCPECGWGRGEDDGMRG